MNYKPSEQELMAYLYDELEGEEKEKVGKYLLENPDALMGLEKLRSVSNVLRTVKDKEVIAPPIFVGESKQGWWEAPYLKTVMGVAASLVFVILVAKLADINMSYKGNEFRLAFGEQQPEVNPSDPGVTAQEVQQMINQSLQSNNAVLNTSWEESQQRLAKSISKNLVVNSDKMNELVKQASTASHEQIQQYVSSLQADNMKLVKDYFTLTSGEQKQYIEGLLVDFAKYLQQQRKNDLQLVEMRMKNLEQNTTEFKQETEQILTSIISSVGTPVPSENKY